MSITRPLHPALYTGLRWLVELGFGRDIALLQPLFAGCGNTADLGCGSAELAAALPAAGYVGLDHDHGQLKYAATLSRAAGRSLGRAELQRLPLADAALDALLFSKVAHHMAQDEVRSVLNEARRVTRPGGRLVIVDVYPTGHGLLHDLLVRRETGEHHRQPAELERLAVDFGWSTLQRFDLRKPTLACYVLVLTRPNAEIRS